MTNASIRPLLLIDIDGVLNPYAATACPPGYEEVRAWPEDVEPMYICEEHGRWLHELSDLFEIAWASAWGDVATETLSPWLDLPEMGWVPFPPIPFDGSLKLPHVKDYVGDRPFAWVDDDLRAAAFAWAAERNAPALLMDIDPALGLERARIEELLLWARELD